METGDLGALRGLPRRPLLPDLHRLVHQARRLVRPLSISISIYILTEFSIQFKKRAVAWFCMISAVNRRIVLITVLCISFCTFLFSLYESDRVPAFFPGGIHDLLTVL